MQATFYNFSKRYNSTKQPSGGEVKNIVLKSQSSVRNPIIALAGNDRPTYNYVQMFDRYYFVNDWSWSSDKLWTAKLDEDVLATYKSAITSSTQFVLYSANASQESIIDGRFVASNEYETHSNAVTIPLFNRTGVFVLGVASAGSSTLDGIIDTFELDSTQMYALNQYINNPEEEGFLTLAKNIFSNPYEAIVYCNWLPITGAAGQTDQEISIAGFNSGVTAKRITSRTFKDQYTVRLPWAESSLAAPDWKRLPPYTQLSLLLPFVGVVDINTTSIYYDNALHIDFALEYSTGAIIYIIRHENDKVIATYSGSVGASIPIARQQENFAGIAGGVLTTIGGAAIAAAGLANLPGAVMSTIGGLGTTAAGISTALTSAEAHTQINGSMSSKVAIEMGFEIIATLWHRPIDYGAKDTILGAPTMQAKVLSFGGYVQTLGASVGSSTAYDSEIMEVNRLLDNGIYLE